MGHYLILYGKKNTIMPSSFQSGEYQCSFMKANHSSRINTVHRKNCLLAKINFPTYNDVENVRYSLLCARSNNAPDLITIYSQCFIRMCYTKNPLIETMGELVASFNLLAKWRCNTSDHEA